MVIPDTSIVNQLEELSLHPRDVDYFLLFPLTSQNIFKSCFWLVFKIVIFIRSSKCLKIRHEVMSYWIYSVQFGEGISSKYISIVWRMIAGLKLIFFSFNNWFIQFIHRIYYNYLQVRWYEVDTVWRTF